MWKLNFTPAEELLRRLFGLIVLCFFLYLLITTRFDFDNSTETKGKWMAGTDFWMEFIVP